MSRYVQVCLRYVEYQICHTLGMAGWIFGIYSMQIDSIKTVPWLGVVGHVHLTMLLNDEVPCVFIITYIFINFHQSS